MIPLLLIPSVSFSAIAEVTWTKPSDYRDIDPGNQNREGFKNKIFSSLNKHFDKLAKKLPEGQTLTIEVTDLDLAGRIDIGTMNQIRIVKEIDMPSITFSYKLVDADKKILSEDSVKLRDSSFLRSSVAKYKSHENLKYEKHMLDKWFDKQFP